MPKNMTLPIKDTYNNIFKFASTVEKKYFFHNFAWQIFLHKYSYYKRATNFPKAQFSERDNSPK